MTTLEAPRITATAARQLLQATGVTDRQARLVLASGLALEPRAGSGRRLLFDAGAVVALAERPVLGADHLRSLCRRGWFVARRSDAVGRASRAEQLELLQDGWDDLSVWYRIGIDAHVERSGPLPFVATVAGFVYLGADIVGIGPGARLHLAAPGSWFDELRETRVTTGPGRPWHLRLPTFGLGGQNPTDGTDQSGRPPGTGEPGSYGVRVNR